MKDLSIILRYWDYRSKICKI